jgi:hypothetical protein
MSCSKNKCFVTCRKNGSSQVLMLWSKQALKLIQEFAEERIKQDLLDISVSQCRLLLNLLRMSEGQIFIATTV